MSSDLVDTNLDKYVKDLSALLAQHDMMLATAESCTGGLIAALMTAQPGTSSVFDRGFVTYSNEAKKEMLNVPATLLKEHGAVSGECAKAMAAGALKNSRASITVSVTGIAGPNGGSAEKPVGLVFIGVAGEGREPIAHKHLFTGNRTHIRTQTCEKAFDHLITALHAA